MTTMGNIWLLRHGSIELPSVKSFIGQWDLPLSLKGQAQIQSWSSFFATKSIAAILSSDLTRCKQSAQLLCLKHIPIVYDKAFREINLGTWEGQSIASIKENNAKDYALRGQNLDTFRPEQGENFNDVAKRVQQALAYYIKQYEGKNLILVAHAGVNRVIIAKYLGLCLKNVLDIPQPYACCTQLSQYFL